ncbi:hypothetical protein N6H14_06985 [Paenibacillus sp. CC-CFT747]|nr:hypothetical protein N6H14_06985 [Paenibacillus sp. CC-CFT747]
MSYKIHVAEAGTYGVHLTIKPQETDAQVEISSEGAKLVSSIGRSPQSDWQDVKAGTIELPAGYHTLKIKVKKESFPSPASACTARRSWKRRTSCNRSERKIYQASSKG